MVGKPAICCFVAIEKRHIAAALLLCPEDGTGAVQLSVVLFLTANNGYTNGCTTADKHKLMQASFGMSALLYSFSTVYIFHAFPLILDLTFNS